jgi:hypothetical protein
MDDLLQRGCTILVGDANGADKAVQQYLAERQYTRVTVIAAEKRTLVYFAPTHDSHVLSRQADLQPCSVAAKSATSTPRRVG